MFLCRASVPAIILHEPGQIDKIEDTMPIS